MILHDIPFQTENVKKLIHRKKKLILHDIPFRNENVQKLIHRKKKNDTP